MKIKNLYYPGAKNLSVEEFYDLARLLIKAGYTVRVNTKEKAGNKNIVTLEYWTAEEGGE